MSGSSFARHAAELLPFCRERGYNDRVALLWDLSRHSGRRRLAVWNFRKGCAEHVFVASHGSGSTRVMCAVPTRASQTRTDRISAPRGAPSWPNVTREATGWRTVSTGSMRPTSRCGLGASCCTGGVTRHIFPSGLWRRSAVGVVPSCRRATWRRWMPFCNASRG